MSLKLDLATEDKYKASKMGDRPEDRPAFIKSKIQEVRASANRIAHEGIWITNIAYMLGYDGLTFNTATRQFQPINRASSYLRKNRIHVNKILPTVQNRLAKLCKNRPRYDVRPESNDASAKDNARLSLQVLTSLWDKLKLDEQRLWLYMWVQQTGHAYLKVCWDEAAGELIVDPIDGSKHFEGDVRVDIVSPFEMFVDPLAKRLEDAQWVIQAKVRKLDYFKLQYPGKGDQVKEEDAWLLSAQYEQRINSINARGPSQGGSLIDFVKNSALELAMYERRTREYPNGRMTIVANGVLLEDKELPCGEIPFAKFDDVIVAGKFYSESLVTHLRPLQDQYNETVRRRAEWTKTLLAGKYVAPKGAGLAQESLNDQSGEVLYYVPQPNALNLGEPHALQVPNIPQYAYSEEEKINEQINYISGISEVSRGSIPSASIPAVGMQLLVEQDDTRIGVVTEQHEHAWAKVGSLLLKYAAKYWVTPRKLKFAGQASEYLIKEISGDDIGNSTDVIVIRGSTLPGSKVLRRQEILNLFSQGLLGNPQDPKVLGKVLSMLEFGDLAEVWEDSAIDQSQVKRMMENIKQGVPPGIDNSPAVDKKNNNALWIQELNRYRKTQAYDSAPIEIKALIEQTIDNCTEAILDLSNAHVQDMISQIKSAPLPGDPGGPPVAAEPSLPEQPLPEGMPLGGK